MKKSLFIFIAAMILLACVSGACAKAPAGEASVQTELPETTEAPLTTPYETVSETEPAGTDAPSGDMLLPRPPTVVDIDFSTYSELYAALTDSSLEGYRRLRGIGLSANYEESIGSAYFDFISGIESGELTLPLPLFDGEPATLARPDWSIWIYSNEKFNLPLVAYVITYGDCRAMVELLPLTVAKGLELTGNETYSDVSKILAPRYPTEDTPKDRYPGSCYISVSACEIELAGGRKVWATIIEEKLSESGDFIRTSYRFVYDDYNVSVWESGRPGSAELLESDFFAHFSLGGSITDFQQ